jgi:superfamily II DNA or RNA helicase
MDNDFPSFRFKAQLRPSQLEVVEIAQRKLAEGQKRLHIVAPPGSGKTILGLYLWAFCARRPALVLSPNSAIQAQWAAKTSLFEFTGLRDDLVSTSPHEPKLLTSLTYQSLTTTAAGDEQIESLSLTLWKDKLVEKGQAADPQEADVWIEDLKRHNPDYYERRLSSYRKQVRD